ncbi:MAG: hypothetical protein CVV64_14110 [Candidatus Wallbacteria bacterium HGW-Wallbacteria-1]|jgi:signal transduction histidine kinase|uniref:DUF5658 domain-containing protein n=1 Tax=Candidatus Wallbacteria bacterium HGW-Wallbacteria-1 TaxID=2013854 RepID=A0A2N1PMH3_9BACT|nr:MAG: hypothetical protein CVV64_14110 [Candidatus Wallbacteria bacterium HGW-Wallbacteria-1]
MKKTEANFRLHLSICLILYLTSALADSWLTLRGMAGNLQFEGNPIMRYLMQNFGFETGLAIGKGSVFLLALLLTLPIHRGIQNESPWVYRLALTSVSKKWMKAKKRYFVAFLPLYLVAASQIFAALSWIWLTY